MRKAEATLKAKARKPPLDMFERIELRKEASVNTLYRWWGLTETGWVPYGCWFQIKDTDLHTH